jgi:hypothetical protein
MTVVVEVEVEVGLVFAVGTLTSLLVIADSELVVEVVVRCFGLIVYYKSGSMAGIL